MSDMFFAVIAGIIAVIYSYMYSLQLDVKALFYPIHIYLLLKKNVAK